MQNLGHLSVRQWGQMSLALVLLTVSILVGVALVVPVAAVGLSLAVLALALGTLVQQTRRVAQRTTRSAARSSGATASDEPTLRLSLADGSVVAARRVHVAHEQEHALLLTRNGYVVVDAQGHPLHTMGE